MVSCAGDCTLPTADYSVSVLCVYTHPLIKRIPLNPTYAGLFHPPLAPLRSVQRCSLHTKQGRSKLPLSFFPTCPILHRPLEVHHWDQTFPHRECSRPSSATPSIIISTLQASHFFSGCGCDCNVVVAAVVVVVKRCMRGWLSAVLRSTVGLSVVVS